MIAAKDLPATCTSHRLAHVERDAAHSEQEEGHTMFKQKKFRQATLILVATAVILILPNLTRLFG
ncbi:hypothetical protein NAV28_03545 [Pseudomonas stutzeri]|nr:hypothetical protein [Stutzerimonas degradans]